MIQRDKKSKPLPIKRSLLAEVYDRTGKIPEEGYIKKGVPFT